MKMKKYWTDGFRPAPLELSLWYNILTCTILHHHPTRENVNACSITVCTLCCTVHAK